MLKTRCVKCRKSINISETYCDECKPSRYKEKKKINKITNIEEKGILDSRKWRKVRKQILIRDNNCCRYCLVNGYLESRKLEVHHLLKRVDREDLMYDSSNLITLCAKHHRMLEDMPYEEQLRLLKLKIKK